MNFCPHAAGGGAHTRAFHVNANKSRSDLFDVDDRAMIIVSARQTTAGVIKKSILAEIDKHNPTPQTIKDIDTKSFDENKLPKAQAYEKSLSDNPSQGGGGHGRNGSSSFLLQADEHCALDTFNAATPRARVRAISGWGAGSASMANVKVDWRSTCTQINNEQSYFFAADLTFVYAFAVGFHIAATASCPVGLPNDRVSLKSQGAPPRLR